MAGRALVFVLWATSAAASPWDVSFPSESVCPLLPPGARSLLIVAAGLPPAEVRSAADALTVSVR